ncbi:TonB-dependent receptor [Sphingomonas sp. RIT328]|uniref:TonB-dependent receptor n=1 Tax=Sphingomonas sp. RIT328 TaxID=1470591 RepID=UPI0004499CB2|nr:TonB-dependent receptor [Sphingomonas sp. RIT328]EZP54176.1 TonB-dependent receptor-like protein [Sphingomonas sp. RIT328]
MPLPALAPLLLAGAALPAAPVSAPAQETAADPQQQADGDSGSTGDIFVTARRRQEKSQDVPIAITAFGAAQIEATRTYNLRDLQQLTPSLVITNTNPRNTSINIRGLGNNVAVYNDGLEPAVGVYLDGVYLARPGQSVFDLADLDTIEVLRGPQGTLFGKNTSAGAIVVATKAPSFDVEAGGDASLGNYDFRQLHAYLTGPITDTLAGRLFVSKTDRDGFTYNRYDGRYGQSFHDLNLRGQLLYQPTDRLKLRLIADWGRQSSFTANSILLGAIRTYDNGTLFANNYYDRAARLGYVPVAADAGLRTTDVDANPRYRMNQHGINVTTDLDLGAAMLTSVTAYRAWNWYPHNDGDSTPLDAGADFHQSNEQKQVSQELRVASTGSRRIDYVAGVYYLYQSIRAEAVNRYGSQAAAWFLAPTTNAAVGAAALNGYDVVSHSRPVTDSYAAFAQTIWHITGAVDLTTGLRYTYETKSGYFDQTATGASLAGLTAAQQTAAQTIRSRYGVANFYEASTEAGRLSGQATLSWKVARPVLAYLTYARGNKFGGLNLANITTTGQYAANPVIRPETIDSYEAGIKTSWAGGRLTANAAAFWTDVKDYQTTIVDIERNGVSFFTNAAKVRTRGLEGDLRAAPTRWLSLYASGTYDDARYISYANAPCPIEITGQTLCDLSGRRLPGVSKYAASAGGELRAPVGLTDGHDTDVYLGADYNYRSSSNTSASLSRYSLIPGYALANIRFGIRAPDGRFDIQVWGRNITNSVYYLSIGAANTGAITGTLGDPRTYGVTLRTKW